MMHIARKRERGVSLIELLVALAILAVALTPLLSIFLHALKVSEKANKMTIAANLARDMAEEIRSADFWEPEIAYDENQNINYYPRDEDVAQPFGLDEGTFTGSRISLLDDVDDYNGWCRGEECTECEGTSSADGLCVDNSPLEAYDGTKYDGTGALPELKNFTRRVEVFNIFPHITSIIPVPEHDVDFHSWKATPLTKPFLFYDYRDHQYPNLSSHPTEGSARGITRLKVVKVTVQYSGPTVPDLGVEELNLVVLPITE